MRDGLGLVEQSLLEADVSFDVTRHFMEGVAEQALGQQVLKSLDPSQQLVGIVHDELVKLMGPVDNSIRLKSSGTTVLMMCGFLYSDTSHALVASSTARFPSRSSSSGEVASTQARLFKT